MPSTEVQNLQHFISNSAWSAVVLDVFIWNPVYQDKVETLQLLISSETDGTEVIQSMFPKRGQNVP